MTKLLCDGLKISGGQMPPPGCAPGITQFEACVTEISICFHSGWHYCCTV